MDLISAAIIEAAIAQRDRKLCELCGAAKQDHTLIGEDGDVKQICKLCHDTSGMDHQTMVLHCFNRVLDQLRKLQ